MKSRKRLNNLLAGWRSVNPVQPEARDERGQSMIEYVIMAGVLVFILVWFARAAPVALNAYYQFFAYVLQSPFP